MAEHPFNSPPPADKPDDPAAPVFGMGDAQVHRLKQQQNTRILWGIFSLLLILVVGVIFILPSYIAVPDPSTATQVIIPVERATPQNALSPFQEAQILREREQAQDILEDILNLQEALEAIGIETWAPDDYQAALAIAAEGDTAYREQNFTGAQQFYQRSLLALQTLETRSIDLLGESIAAGFAAIENRLPVQAQNAFNLALMIDPDSQEALAGLERAQLLPDVLALLEQGEALTDAGDLEAALARYEEAASIDPAHTDATAAIEQTRIAILNRNFQNLMSEGFRQIQAGNPEGAIASFNDALALRPNSADAQAAITQAEDMIISRDLNEQLTAARDHEAAERWQDALSAYNTALAIDANVVAAAEGRERTQLRVNLDNYLNGIISDPYRLSEDSVYQQTIMVYNEALELVDQNNRTRLYDQLLQVRGYLDQARVPVPVTIRSDGMTSVTVRRVGEMGMLNSHTLELIPGNYTAVGVRPGYRDVRQDFTVSFNGEAPVVTVICSEPV